jgi:type I site-specific restriction endonuclease
MGNIVLMRSINSMIEFKPIIGRGTRLYDGKDYFTIYDFVKAHHHFNDPEWEGEPLEPEPKEPSLAAWPAYSAKTWSRSRCAAPKNQGQARRRQSSRHTGPFPFQFATVSD